MAANATGTKDATGSSTHTVMSVSTIYDTHFPAGVPAVRKGFMFEFPVLSLPESRSKRNAITAGSSNISPKTLPLA